MYISIASKHSRISNRWVYIVIYNRSCCYFPVADAGCEEFAYIIHATTTKRYIMYNRIKLTCFSNCKPWRYKQHATNDDSYAELKWKMILYKSHYGEMYHRFKHISILGCRPSHLHHNVKWHATLKPYAALYRIKNVDKLK